MHRSTDQRGFSDCFVDERLGNNRRLERIDALIDWPLIAAVVAKVHAAPEGRKAYPPLVMVKALLLQQWYCLSDPGLEEALGDRLSFRRFCGLGLDDGTPDHSTISRFRKVLRESRLDDALMAAIEQQLDGRGLIIRQGTLLDATIIEAHASRPSMNNGAGASSAVDPDAVWTRKGGRSYLGYKAHIGVDAGSGVIRRAVLSPARINESLVADDLICGDERAVYADKGYENKHRRQRLREAGIKDRIMHRSHKNQRALPVRQAQRNRLIAPKRAPVEAVFGTLKRLYDYRRVRYCSLGANQVELVLKVIAYNLRRAEKLLG